MGVVVALLSENDNPLPKEYKDHPLKGKYAGFGECHIRPDWLLVYQKNKNELILLLARTNTHSEIFE
jgi:mRNA interferase YafQ